MDQMNSINEEDQDHVTKVIKYQWQMIRILRLFLHHVFSSEKDPQIKNVVTPNLGPIGMYLKELDLKTHATFKEIIQVLKIINNHATKQHYTGGFSESGQCKEIPAKHVGLSC